MEEKQITRALPAKFVVFASQTILFETGGDKSGAFHKTSGDKGGETKWGISKQAHPEVDIENLTYRDALHIYESQYWDNYYNFIGNEKVAFKLYDMGVLMGKRRAVKKLQRAIRKQGTMLRIDGMFGPITLTGCNLSPYDNLYETYIDLLQSYFKLISIYGKNRKFLRGWLKRLYWVWSTDEKEKGING